VGVAFAVCCCCCTSDAVAFFVIKQTTNETQTFLYASSFNTQQRPWAISRGLLLCSIQVADTLPLLRLRPPR
jgi:hypothetical protein